MTTYEGPTVDATRTSFRVLEVLRELSGGGVTEVATRLDVPKSTVHKHLQTLRTLGYVVKDGSTYHLDAPLAGFGQHVRERDPLLQAAADEVRRLASMTKATAGLYVARGGRGFDVIRAGDDEGIDSLPQLLHCTAPGKAILSELPRDVVDDVIDQYGLPAFTDNTITSREELHEERTRVQNRGIAFDREEYRSEVRGVAIPITTEKTVRGAMYVVGDADRLTGKWIDENTPGIVVSCVNAIEQDLRGRKSSSPE